MIKVPESFDIDYIDPSAISTFNRCPAKYLFSRLMGLRKPDKKPIILDYGTDIHKALPYCYDPATVDKAVEIFTESWNKREYEYDEKRNVERAEVSLYNFASSHPSDMCPYEIIQLDITAPTQDKISKNEVPFLIDIGGKLSLAGRIDAAVRWKSDGSLFALDFKTASEISPRYFNCFENSPQAIAYTLALSQIAGERASGLIIEAIRVSKRNAESQMHLIFVKDHQISSFIRFANATASKILECNEKKEWPRHCSNCTPYSSFGIPGYTCEYLTICDSPSPNDMFRFYKKGKPFHPFIINKGTEDDNT